MVDRQWTRRLCWRNNRGQPDPPLSRLAYCSRRLAAWAQAPARQGGCNCICRLPRVAAVHQPLEERRDLSGGPCEDRKFPSRLLGSSVWRYEIEDRQIEARIWMEPGAHTTYAAWRLLPDAGAPENGFSLRLTLLANNRDHHGTMQVGSFDPEIRVQGDTLLVTDAGLSLSIRAPGGSVAPKRDWYRDFDLPVERERGLDATDNHLCVGEATVPLVAGQWCGIVASLEPDPPSNLAAALARRLNHDRAIVANALASSARMRHAPSWIARLALSADAFVFSRPIANPAEGKSVIAGYPWFGDWGRDTMISLPGLTLATGRPEIALRILRTFAGFVSEGMLPNLFPGAGDQPEYNTADASLWFFEAWRAYFAETEDENALREVFPVLSDMIEWHERGTRYGIGMDSTDSLLKAGVPGIQLTWMDVKIGDWVVTPRVGKAGRNQCALVQRLAHHECVCRTPGEAGYF